MRTSFTKSLKLKSNQIHKTEPSDNSHQSPKFSKVKNFDSHVQKVHKALSSKREDDTHGSPYQSSFTLQQSVQKISFSKADRFPKLKDKDHITSAILLPSTLKSYKCNLGYGQKNYLPKYVETKALENPSPSTYLPSQEDLPSRSPLHKHKKGPTFGIPYTYYDKTYIPGCRIQNVELNKAHPGPGKYEKDRELGDLNIANKRRVNITIKSKRTDFIEEELKKDQSPKKYYFPNRELVDERRFNGVSFGRGDKFDFTYSPVQEFPGPGQYESKIGRFMKKPMRRKK